MSFGFTFNFAYNNAVSVADNVPYIAAFPATDTLGGGDYNSTAIDDDYFPVRWTEILAGGGGTASINDERLRLTANTTNPSGIYQRNNSFAAGDFTIIARSTFISFLADKTVSQGNNFRVRQADGSFLSTMYLTKGSATANSLWLLSVDTPTNNTILTNWSNDYIWFKVVRVGSTISHYYSSNGADWTDTGVTVSYSGNVFIDNGCYSRWTGGNLTVEWDNLSYAGFADQDATYPVVSGTPTVGETLSCTTGLWANSPTEYTYQWQADGVDIAEATSSTYVLTESESGKDVSCDVTATNANGSATESSNALTVSAS